MIENPRIKPDSDQQQVLFVGKHGSDTSDGETLDRAFLTFGAAITAAGTPADEANAVTVECVDDGEYTENLTIPSHVHIHAPNATLKGYHQPQGVNHLRLRRMTNNGNLPVLFNLAGIEVQLDVDRIDSDSTGSTAVHHQSGSLVLRVKELICTVSADCITAADFGTGADVYLDIDHMELADEGITCSGATVWGRIGRIHSSSAGAAIEGDSQGIKAYLTIGEIDCPTAWTLNAVSELYLICSKITGTRTEAAGSKVRVTEAQRNNYTATTDPTVNDDAADGYTVGSVWIDVTADDAYVCCDSMGGAAVWKKTTP